MEEALLSNKRSAGTGGGDSDRQPEYSDVMSRAHNLSVAMQAIHTISAVCTCCVVVVYAIIVFTCLVGMDLLLNST